MMSTETKNTSAQLELSFSLECQELLSDVVNFDGRPEGKI